MHVFGYTEADLEVVRRDWPAARVAELGIHPFEIDLLDADPILIEDGERQLRFRRLDNFKFAYRDAGGRAILGLCDNGDRACVACRIVKVAIVHGEDGPYRLTLERVESLNDAYAEHFAEYLRRIYESDRAEEVYHRLGDIHYLQGGKLEIVALRVRDARELYPVMQCRFTGEMLKERHFKADWPEWIASLLETLKPWHPMVVGSAPRDLLLGREINHVEIHVHCESLQPQDMQGSPRERARKMNAVASKPFDAVKQAGHRLLDHQSTWVAKQEGKTFNLRACLPDEKSFEEQIRAIVAEWVAAQGLPVPRTRPPAKNSAEDVFGRDDQIVTSRIAMHDLSRQQSRLLVPRPRPLLIPSGSMPERYEQLKAEGISIVADPFSAWHIADGCHCEPIVPAFMDAFRRATCIDWESKQGHSFETVLEAYASVPGLPELLAFNPINSALLRRQAPLNEGDGGMSPQQMNDLLAEMAEHALDEFRRGERKAACFTSSQLHAHLKQAIQTSHALDSTQKGRWLWILEELDKIRRKRLGALFQFASVSEPERICQDVYEKYIEHVRARTTMGRQARLPNGGRHPVDEQFLQQIERTGPLSISSSTADRWRMEVVAAHQQASREYRERVPYTAHRKLAEAIENYVLTQFSQTIGLTVVMPTSSAEQYERINTLQARLEHTYGYCPECSRELLTEIALNRSFLTLR